MNMDDIKDDKPPKKIAPAFKKRKVGNCESCEFYDYDEFYQAYICRMNLDQDERARFIAGDSGSCPYYRYYDEYKSVNKQI